MSRLTAPEEVSSTLRRFLKIERERLRIAERLGAGSLWLARARSCVLDALVTYVFRFAAGANAAEVDEERAGCALFALGGYGREELSPYSDLDLLFLQDSRPSLQTRETIERTLHLLWDSGLSVGHKSSNARDVFQSARADSHLQTALLAARFICGDLKLAGNFEGALESWRTRSARSLISTVVREMAERRAHHSAVVCLQEPNVKDGAGGLRDLQSALWAAHARWGVGTLESLRELNVISEEELARTKTSHQFLLSVRAAMHRISGRKADRLSLDLQTRLAQEFGFSSRGHLLASEKFMREYYRCARQIKAFSEAILARASIGSVDTKSRWFRSRARQGEAFSISRGELQLEADATAFFEDAQNFFAAFMLAQKARVPFSQPLCEAVAQNLYAVNRDFRNSPKSSENFLALLGQKGRVGQSLRLMHETGFLSRYLPEFARISLLIQHDLYHHYTIDEHTLRAVEALDALETDEARANSFLRSRLNEVEDVSLLYLGILLHDIGKGRGPRHIPRGVSLARKILARMGLGGDRARKVLLLVQHHVLMAQVAQRRDLRDPRTAENFARAVESLDVLNMLLLLTYADMNGVGPNVWSDWKATLLQELYERTRALLSGKPFHSSADETLARLKDEVIKELLGETPLSEIERHFALMPDRYLSESDAARVVAHIRLLQNFDGQTPAISWTPHTRASTTELTVCARDRRGLFADLAGALASQGVEILSADLRTREDGIALDAFILREAATHSSVAEHRLPKIEQAIRACVSGALDVAAEVERWRTRHAPRRPSIFSERARSSPVVICDNETSGSTTIVEVRARDEHGLAYKIAHELTRLGLDIVCAKISTEKHDALDSFYVTNARGEKLSDAEIHELTARLVTTLSATEQNRSEVMTG